MTNQCFSSRADTCSCTKSGWRLPNRPIGMGDQQGRCAGKLHESVAPMAETKTTGSLAGTEAAVSRSITGRLEGSSRVQRRRRKVTKVKVPHAEGECQHLRIRTHENLRNWGKATSRISRLSHGIRSLRAQAPASCVRVGSCIAADEYSGRHKNTWSIRPHRRHRTSPAMSA